MDSEEATRILMRGHAGHKHQREKIEKKSADA
jgi:hypothetical protein